jgi:hypothetical protein
MQVFEKRTPDVKLVLHFECWTAASDTFDIRRYIFDQKAETDMTCAYSDSWKEERRTYECSPYRFKKTVDRSCVSGGYKVDISSALLLASYTTDARTHNREGTCGVSS